VGRVLARVLPLALGAAVNTRVLATQAALLTESARPLWWATVFGAGAAAPLLLIGLVDLISVQVTVSAVSRERALFASSVADIAIGAVLLLAAVRVSRGGRERRGDARPPAPRSSWRRMFLRGAAVMATDLSTMALFVTASKDVAVSHLGVLVESLLFLLVLAITAVTAWFPPLLFLRDAPMAQRLLEPIGRQVQRHGRAIATVVLTALGAYLVGRGVLGVT
jgi:threonine/homoserine/homoserine lactone efflux protein